ncbi:MAG: ABC transporter ATP-binding protein/permease [Lachnospiraceae bacterium]|nr:ABC transporter ATP-binding protein/permease [Lachnospiraceae bacterium]
MLKNEKRLLLIVAVTGIIYNIGMTAGPWFEGQMVQYLCDIIGRKRQPAEMIRLVLCYVPVLFFIQFMRCLKRLYVRKFANNISKSIKMTIYENLLYQRKTGQELPGDMMTKIIADADACVEGIRKFTTEVFDTGVVMAAYLVMLLSYDWKLTLISMLFPPVAYFLAEKLKVVVTGNVARCRESSARLNTATLDRVANALTYRVYGQETNQNACYESYLADYEKKAVKANIWENAMQPIYQVISMIGTVMIIWFGGKNVLGAGWTLWNVAAFTTFFSCYKKLAVKSSKAAKLFNAVQKAQVSWKRIKPYLHTQLVDGETDDAPGKLLSVRNLTFSYPGQEPLFSGVSFDAEAGQVIGITGEVACGKSTFGKIFTGELPYQGQISLGNRVFSNQGEHYETCVGYLGHQPELFSGTIEENICLGKPGDIAPVLCAVCMDAEVAALPEGINTRIGSGGVRLSGGQQARIALARTLYHRKQLMILDDPFSAVDMETESRIFANLRPWAKDSIVLLISHRLALFPQMDQILWMEHGVVSSASHQALLEEKTHYRSLYYAQRKEGESDVR